VQAKNKTDAGLVVFFNAKDLSFMSKVAVGSLPDMLTFSPNGKTVLVANEAEPNDDYSIDPEGSVSIIDIQDIKQPKASIADFRAWNSQKADLMAKGVRIFGPNATVAQDLEPEYITISGDSKTAWVTLQEN
ncbi:choice-of-anchor I domain-containing protein, partial [Acinetobacter ursingii]